MTCPTVMAEVAHLPFAAADGLGFEPGVVTAVMGTPSHGVDRKNA